MLTFLRKQTPKFIQLNRAFSNKHFTLLDVGSGNHSPSKTKALFPNCEYHGIDLDANYGYSSEDMKAMHAFYEMDLTKNDLNIIPDNYFDFISMNHIIEHLSNGDEVINRLSSKLKPGGFIYIEYPGKRSTHLPSMHGTLNFYDDATHVRVYSTKELSKVLEQLNFQIISTGTRRNIIFILAMPFRIIATLIKLQKLNANIFWDILGFAEYVLAKKCS